MTAILLAIKAALIAAHVAVSSAPNLAPTPITPHIVHVQEKGSHK